MLSVTPFRQHSARPYSDVEIADVVALTWREYHRKYPDRSHEAYRSYRRRLRDEGAVFPDGRSEPRRYLPAPIIELPETGEELTPNDIWELMDKAQEVALKRSAQKVRPEITIRITSDRPIGVCFMSDFHLGNTGTDHRALLEDVSLVTSCPYLTAFVGGDGIDNMVVGKLAAVQRDNGSVGPDLQYLAFADVLNRILPNLLAIGTGNHDNWTKQLAGIDGLSAAIADKPIVNTGERALIRLFVNDIEYVILRKHRPVYRSVYNAAHAVAQLYRLGEIPFDVGVIEHEHTPWIGPFEAHGRMRVAVRTGSYKVIDSFAREFTVGGGGIGTPVVVFYPFEKKMLWFPQISDAIEHLEID